MYLKNLSIRDFGILQNQNLTNLNSDLVVIGGLNRSGKTTTLQALRYLGYGLPRDDSIPPAHNEYDLQADYRWQGQDYNLLLQGYGSPQINNLSGGSSSKNIYADLDSYTYQQLFTISLKELYQLPDKPQEQKKMQSILLGAGLSDILEIQQLKEEFKSTAENIGGKNGSCHVYDFKEYHQQIKTGLNLREEAQQQLTRYQKLEEELEELASKIQNKTAAINSLQADITILDLLKTNYKNLEQKKELEMQAAEYDYSPQEEKYTEMTLQEAEKLKENLREIKEEIARQKKKIREETGVREITELQQKLISKQDKIKNFNYKLSGLKEKRNNYWDKKKKLSQKKQELLRELKAENESWEDFEIITDIQIDKETEDQLYQIINQWQQVKNDYQEQQKKVKDLKQKQDQIITELESLDDTDLIAGVRKYYLFAGGFVCVGIFSSLIFNLWLGIVLVLVGVIGVAINYSSTYLLNSNQMSRQQNLNLELNSLQQQIKQAEEKLENMESDQERLTAQVNKYRTQFKLSAQASGDLIKDRFAAIKNLKRRIRDWQQDKEELQANKAELQAKLKQIKNLFHNFSHTKLPTTIVKEEDLIPNSKQIMTNLKKLSDYVALGEDLATLKGEEAEIIAEILELIGLDSAPNNIEEELSEFIKDCKDYFQYKELKNKLHKIKSQLKSSLRSDLVEEARNKSSFLATTKKISGAFTELFDQYSSLDKVKEDYQTKKQELATAKEDLTSLQDEYTTHKNEKNDLASSDKLKQAQKKIEQGRQKLRPLAEKFAVQRAAAFILDEVQERFITKVQDEMLAPASKILSELTQGEYQQIIPHNDLSKVDFKLQSAVDNTTQTIADLSRGTQEQLFLAVRMSRIKEIEPNLPVILDDSLVNFDLMHQSRVMEQLMQLTASHQVFILTCHPQLVKLCADYENDVQYWGLNEGKFELSTADKLIKHLSI